MITVAELRSIGNKSLSFRFPIVEEFSLGYVARFKLSETTMATAPTVGYWKGGRCNDISLKTTLVAGLKDESHYYQPMISNGESLVKFIEGLHDLCLPPKGKNSLELCRLTFRPAMTIVKKAGTIGVVGGTLGETSVLWFAQTGVVTEVQASFSNLVARDGHPLVAQVSLSFTPYAGARLQGRPEPMAPGPSRSFSFTKAWNRFPAGSISGGGA